MAENDFKSFSQKKLPKEWEEEAARAMAAVEGKGEGDVLREIVARAEKAKREGTLSNAEIDAFVAQLTSEDRRKAQTPLSVPRDLFEGAKQRLCLFFALLGRKGSAHQPVGEVAERLMDERRAVQPAPDADAVFFR